MASIQIEIPDAQVPRVLEAFAESFGYDPASGLTKAQFAKKQTARWVKEITLNYERQKALAAITDASLDVT